MLLIWKGFGLLVPLSAILALFVTEFIYIDKDGNGEIKSEIFYLFSAVFCLIISYAVKRYRRATCEEAFIRNEKNQKEKKVLIKNMINKKTGETYAIIIKDTFFGIPMMIWSPIFVALGVVVYASNFWV
jgi:hypothetical protein